MLDRGADQNTQTIALPAFGECPYAVNEIPPFEPVDDGDIPRVDPDRERAANEDIGEQSLNDKALLLRLEPATSEVLDCVSVATCYDGQPPPAGAIEFAFEIEPDGRVRSVDVTPSPALDPALRGERDDCQLPPRDRLGVYPGRMTRHGLILVCVGSLAIACTGDDGAAGTEGDSEGTGSTGAPMTTAPMTTASMTTMPSDGTSTGDPPAGTTDGGTTAGPADSSGSGGPGSGSGETGNTSTGGGEAVYMACDPTARTLCPDPWDVCYDFIAGFDVCTLPCANAEECPAPPDGDAVPVCAGTGMDQCLLDCQNDETCPGGMECQSINAGGTDFFRCVWPTQ